MKYYIFLFTIIYSCSVPKDSIKRELTIDKFRERALCNCIVMGLDSSRNNQTIQKLIPYNPEEAALFDSVILQNLKPVIEKIYADSAQRVDKVTEAAQGKHVYSACLIYYKSIELHKLAKAHIRNLKKIKNLEELVSNKYPTW